ncbi:hypothetical protein PHYBLDRAFT_171506 [Phycomyces blakesleeanus NRRL 1555(-)]|uniref:Uncharacterized protein n=1 Tax=Phycomyces blakesleeanus (strain ATCC 8743b / DSM 1359 / FGSC 10004 / NBRC 33097 / NRRL 1555) TaxID=763407 RepID=A0A167LCD0_PHYB8|nr:hypothetical protein PHYBLDRAFT_171506 [Phycomyces blakesleeanus NRRL 1555(-)]OAD70119.1 hypothetical protein PHYBLDRAFT_171506 [Phycomyces blakesleeanus NRRL 1555(-)]|eukprot:XP_018288159.1 hypothetical protein PHYBLDRAFT_171506 [Phycomyces blakesleeanus NRRL 1555(-)]
MAKQAKNTLEETIRVDKKPEVWMEEIIKLETLFRSCEGSQQVAKLLNKIKNVTSEFEGKTGNPSINFQAPEKIKYPDKRNDSALSAPQKNGLIRPVTALEDYQYDKRTSVGKRVKFQPGFPVSHEIVGVVKGGFNLTADGRRGFRVLAHLIYKDQNKFPLVKRDMISVLPKYKETYANTFGTDIK